MPEIIMINPDTWRIEDTGVRCFLLKGTDKALMIDTGMNLPNARNIAEGLTDLPLILLNTHADPDHISGNALFHSFYMNEKEEENYKEHGGIGTYINVSEGDTIDLGNRILEIIEIPGHTPGSIAVLDRKYRVLIGGDSVQDGKIFMFGKHRNMKNYIASMNHLMERIEEFDIVYPSHGSFPVQPALISQLIEYAQKIEKGSAEGKTVDIFGNSVMLYSFEKAVFLCETK